MALKNIQRCIALCVLWVCLLTTLLIHLINSDAFVTEYSVLQTHVRYLENCYCSKTSNFFVSNNNCSMLHTTKVNFQTGSEVADYKVPNIVHYTWLSDSSLEFKFHHMLSILSVHKFVKPDVIYFHTNNPPIGLYWNKVKDLPEFNITYRKPHNEILGIDIRGPVYETSTSNVERLKVLSEYGGIYMDLDYIALNSFDPLRIYPCTVGTEQMGRVCGGLIICAKDSPFLYMWMNSFITDYRSEWAYNTGLVPVTLWRQCPNLVHVEPKLLQHPNYHDAELGQVLNTTTWWKWRKNYGVHLWFRKWKGYLKRHPNVTMREANQTFESIKTLKNTYGEIARTILYNTSEIIKYNN